MMVGGGNRNRLCARGGGAGIKRAWGIRCRGRRGWAWASFDVGGRFFRERVPVLVCCVVESDGVGWDGMGCIFFWR